MKIICKCGKPMEVSDSRPCVYPISRDYCEKCGILIYEVCPHGETVLNEIGTHKHGR